MASDIPDASEGGEEDLLGQIFALVPIMEQALTGTLRIRTKQNQQV